MDAERSRMTGDDPWSDLEIRPLTSRTWDAFTALFGEKGACGNCWCMYYRLSNTEFREGKQHNGTGNP